MNQQEFYNLPEVIEQLEIQKQNSYRSDAHKAAFEMVEKIADKVGCGNAYRAAGGAVYD